MIPTVQARISSTSDGVSDAFSFGWNKFEVDPQHTPPSSAVSGTPSGRAAAYDDETRQEETRQEDQPATNFSKR